MTDEAIDVPEANTSVESIPITYVPARNTVFLSLALAWSEVLEVRDIFVGVNAVDYSGYPDCRPAFIKAYEHMANLATRAGVEQQKLTIHAPLIDMTKAEIVQQGTELGVDYSLTVSCYQADVSGAACGFVTLVTCAARALPMPAFPIQLDTLKVRHRPLFHPTWVTTIRRAIESMGR